MDKVSDCIVREELSYMSQAFASSWSAHSHLGIWPIWKIGTEQQKKTYLAKRPYLSASKPSASTAGPGSCANTPSAGFTATLWST